MVKRKKKSLAQIIKERKKKRLEESKTKIKSHYRMTPKGKVVRVKQFRQKRHKPKPKPEPREYKVAYIKLKSGDIISKKIYKPGD